MKIQGNNPVESQGQSTRTAELDKYRDNQIRGNTHKADDGKDRVTISEEAKEIQRNSGPRGTDRVEDTNRAYDTGDNNHDSTTGARDILDRV